MKLKKRQKLCILLILFTAVLSIAALFILPDQMLVGYRVMNGIEHKTYVPKVQGVLQTNISSIFAGVLWHAVAQWNDKKIAAEPELRSYRIRGAFINVLFFLLTSIPLAFCIGNFVLVLSIT